MDRHPCLKAQVTCYIETFSPVYDRWVPIAVGENSCVSQAGPDRCARENYLSGIDYELCGPPIHAETAALESVDLRELLPLVTGPQPVRARVTGQDWICKDCMTSLLDAGINTFVVEPGGE